MGDSSPEAAPEAADARAARALEQASARLGISRRLLRIARRVTLGVLSDGAIHAGNLAYLTLVSLFPFFIVVTALAQLFGHSDDGMQAVASFLHVIPRSVGDLLRPAIDSVLAARTGSLLWLGALVGLWTVGSFIGTIRDILRRAYGAPPAGSFLHYRLSSVAIVILSALIMMLAFAAQVALTAAEQFIYRLLPFAQEMAGWIGLSRLVPAAVMFGALYMLFFTLTPPPYRMGRGPKWPGALFTAVWWLGVTMVLPLVLGRLGNYDRTYGSLAGFVIMLLFFWLVGFGLVIGAHVNAALAESPDKSLKEPAKETKETAWPV